jgi:hypothetical protein
MHLPRCTAHKCASCTQLYQICSNCRKLDLLACLRPGALIAMRYSFNPTQVRMAPFRQRCSVPLSSTIDIGLTAYATGEGPLAFCILSRIELRTPPPPPWAGSAFPALPQCKLSLLPLGTSGNQLVAQGNSLCTCIPDREQHLLLSVPLRLTALGPHTQLAPHNPVALKLGPPCNKMLSATVFAKGQM